MRSADGWRLRVEHVTRFVYPAPVRASYNEIRQTPLTTSRQTTLESNIRTSPHALQNSYWDYWGTQVVYFNVDAPHEELTIRGRALVETQLPEDSPASSWAEVDAESDRLSEFIAPSRYTEPGEAIREAAATLRRATPEATVRAVSEWVRESLDYVSGVTSVHTSAAEAHQTGYGVCQDFAHLAIAVLRVAGVPTRYVSGYFHPDPEAQIGKVEAGESHAWVEAWLGRWWGIDPTNPTEIGERHVTVARGRDYADVAPVKGVFAGHGEHVTEVSVTITRVA